ncbi:MAG: secretin N-terminal domain-containing protein [Gammaproteobacteria bacterium]
MLKTVLFVFTSVYVSLVYAQDSVLEIITLQNRPAEEVQTLLAPLLEASERVAADGANLIVRAPPERLAQIKALVEQLDAKLHNLLITVVQSEKLSADELNAGADIRLNIPLNKPSDISGRIQGRYAERQSRGGTDNTQTLRTLEGRTAYIQTGQSRPVQNITIYNAGSGYPAAVGSTTLIEATTGFAVTPYISGNAVIMTVSPWSGRLQNRGAIATQSASTQLSAKLGEWIELGAVRQTGQFRRDAPLAQRHEIRNSDLRILVKVDLID